MKPTTTMALAAIILSAICLTGNCGAGELSDGELIAEVTWQIIHAVDLGQTLYIASHPDKYYEFNPLIGKHPSQSKVWMVMGTTAILHPIITKALPKDWRRLWLAGSLGISVGLVRHNFSMGIKVAF